VRMQKCWDSTGHREPRESRATVLWPSPCVHALSCADIADNCHALAMAAGWEARRRLWRIGGHLPSQQM
jgi:hypothetical protein